MKPETLKLVRAQADAYAEKVADRIWKSRTYEDCRLELRDAFLRGADSAATAMLAEKRER